MSDTDSDSESAKINISDRLDYQHSKILFDFAKNGRYTDLSLEMQDGTLFSCHRCILAASSNYFEGMLSSGMRESAEGKVRLTDISSSIMALVIEYIYKRDIRVSKANFFDLIMAADMFQLTGLRRNLINYLGRSGVYGTDTDLHLQALSFCRDFPVVAKTCGLMEKPIYEKLREQSGTGNLIKSEAFLSQNHESFSQLFWESKVASEDPKTAVKWIAHWGLNPALDDVESTARLGHASSFLEQMPLMEFGEGNRCIGELKRVLSGAKYFQQFFNSIERIRTRQKPLIILPHQEEGSSIVNFIEHNVETGESFFLESPPPIDDIPVCGTPQLMTTASEHDQKNRSLYCLQAVPKAKYRDDPNDHRPSVVKHFFSFSKEKWVLEEEDVKKYKPRSLSEVEKKIPLKNLGALFPSLLPLGAKGDTYVRLSREAANDDSACTNHQVSHSDGHLSDPEDIHSGLNGDDPKPNESKSDAERPIRSASESDVAPGPSRQISESEKNKSNQLSRSMVEVLTTDTQSQFRNTVKERDTSETNLWQCLLSNIEVTGFGYYTRQLGGDRYANAVVFGNSLSKSGTRRPVNCCGSNRVKQPFPDGAADVPLSVVSTGDLIYVLASSPFATSTKPIGKTLNFIQPRLWIYKPHLKWGMPHRTDGWISIRTPSFPDIDYASIFYDQYSGRISLVLVQRVQQEAAFTAARKKLMVPNWNQDNPTKLRRSARKAGVAAHVPNPSTMSKSDNFQCKTGDGRLVGYFQLKFDFFHTSYFINMSLDQLWDSLPVSQATADFLALGCRRPGEVRIVRALINCEHLKQASLCRDEEGGDVRVVVSNSGSDAHRGKPSQWTAFQDSSYRKVDDIELQKALNLLYRNDRSFSQSLKQRKIDFPLSPGQVLPPHTIPFFPKALEKESDETTRDPWHSDDDARFIPSSRPSPYSTYTQDDLDSDSDSDW